MQEDKDIINIVKLFLSLHKTYLKLPLSALSAFSCVDENLGIFELKAQKEGRWVLRRMSVQEIGKEIGKKSRCFKVTYGDTLVVKIPDSPITNLQAYLNIIRKNNMMAKSLLPEINSVVPEVSIILNKINIFNKKLDLEADYIDWLEKNSNYQQCFKVGNNFAFFMNFSKYYFLSEVLDLIQDEKFLKESIEKEILNSSNLLWDVSEFEEKYGGNTESVSIFLGIDEVYSFYKDNLQILLKDNDLADLIFEDDIRTWFLSFLADKEIQELTNQELPDDFIKELSILFKQLDKTYKDDIENYKKIVKNYIKNILFAQNRQKIAVISLKLFELLVFLKNKKMAFRDLKPDNLFVKGDSEQYPFFLQSEKAYSLGLIDFETALFLGKQENKIKKENEIEQPILGGTPSYSTPSQMFPNQVLISSFGNILKIFYFQDWYAVIAMIYLVATGEALFEKTKVVQSRVLLAIKKAHDSKVSMTEVLKISSEKFWKSAFPEFKEKMQMNKQILASVGLELSKKAKFLLTEESRQAREFFLKHVDISKISVYKLLIIMFDTVFRAMFLKEWNLENAKR